MKIATHVLLFGQDKWIMRNIENSYPHVDKIYIAHSKIPWTYNVNANQYLDTFDTTTLLQSKYADKIHLIEGIWNTEEDQRNACVDQAIKDGMDFLIIHDADEFYFHSGFQKLIQEIKNHPEFDYYKIHWRTFWKDFNYVLVDNAGLDFTGCPQFCINLRNGVRFQNKRTPNKDNWYLIKYDEDDKICYHASYVLSDQEVDQKINTWGHVHDFNRHDWYENVWLKWTPEMKNLHPVSPSAWAKAVIFVDQLPEVVRDLYPLFDGIDLYGQL